MTTSLHLHACMGVCCVSIDESVTVQGTTGCVSLSVWAFWFISHPQIIKVSFIANMVSDLE